MNIEDFINRVEKEYGKNIYVPMDTEEDFDVISTGSLSLDIASGIGGLPTRKMIEIYGAEGSGKSTLSLIVSKNYIESYDKHVAYVDVENMTFPDYVKQIFGYDPKDRFHLFHPLTSEDSLSIAEESIKSGLFGVVVIDSIGALSPRKEVESDLDKDSYSGSAKLLARFLRRITPYVNHNNVMVIFINQVRDNVGSYVGGYTTPGGHSLKHFTTIRLMLSASTKIQDDKDIIGNYVKFVYKKNKVAPPFMSGEFPLIFGKGIDYITDVINVATKFGILIRRGSYYYFEGEQIGQGSKQVADKLGSDNEILDRIIKMCYNIANIGTEEV